MYSSSRILASLLIVTQLGLGACVATEREAAPSGAPDQRGQFVPPTGRGQPLSGATVLHTVRTTHRFSNPQQPDVFVLQLRGPRILTSQLHLIILASQGDTLRHEVLPARALLDDPALRDNASASVRDKEIDVLRTMNNFLSDSHFVQPAVPAAAPRPPAVAAPAWNSLRQNPAAVGFDFTDASGVPKRLVYSPQLQQVIVYDAE